MCFFIKDSKIKIATPDIPCYKTVRRSHDGYFSMYQDFDYKCNKEYSGKSKLKLFLKWLFNLDITKEAYHSYTYISGGLNAEECFNEIGKHQPFGYIKYKDRNSYYPISFGDNSDFDYLFENRIFADGTPFGIKEEE